MSNYNKATNFAVKDTLTSGDPDKVVSGAEIDNEFNAIASAVSSKTDKVISSTTDNFVSFDSNGNIKDSGESSSSISNDIEEARPPAGTVVMFASQTAPNGWLECDGSDVSRSNFSDLFNNIGTSFGSGDGSTTFTLPDLRGEFVRGWDNGRGADSGRSFGSSQGDAIRNITGSFQHRSDSNTGQARGEIGAFTGQAANNPPGSAHSGGSNSARRVNFDASREVPTADENRPRNIALMYIIKT
jgi:microcystin-dependent protein